jgi:hypothetical protein
MAVCLSTNLNLHISIAMDVTQEYVQNVLNGDRTFHLTLMQPGRTLLVVKGCTHVFHSFHLLIYGRAANLASPSDNYETLFFFMFLNIHFYSQLLSWGQDYHVR